MSERQRLPLFSCVFCRTFFTDEESRGRHLHVHFPLFRPPEVPSTPGIGTTTVPLGEFSVVVRCFCGEVFSRRFSEDRSLGLAEHIDASPKEHLEQYLLWQLGAWVMPDRPDEVERA